MTFMVTDYAVVISYLFVCLFVYYYLLEINLTLGLDSAHDLNPVDV